VTETPSGRCLLHAAGHCRQGLLVSDVTGRRVPISPALLVRCTYPNVRVVAIKGSASVAQVINLLHVTQPHTLRVSLLETLIHFRSSQRLAADRTAAAKCGHLRF